MSSSHIRPLGNRVVVQRNEVLASKGGILLPESAQKKQQRGTVLAVGPGKADSHGKVHPSEIRAGDEVLFSTYAGSEYKQDAEEFLILAEDDILAIVK